MVITTAKKRTLDVRDREFDFTAEPEIRAGATITGATVVVSNGAAGLTIGTVAVSGGRVQVPLSAGTDKTRYVLRCDATTNTGKTLVRFGRLYCVDLAG
jgi:hypothetical protein